MSAGERFLQKCLDTPIITDPWPHQVLDNTFDDTVFNKLKTISTTKLAHIITDKLIHIHPAQYVDYGIDFYDETLDICDTLYKNLKNMPLCQGKVLIKLCYQQIKFLSEKKSKQP